MQHDVQLDIAAMQAAAAKSASLLKVLGNPDRLILLCFLTQGEYCVSELVEISGIVQPTLSQQLAVLREEQLVSTRREGKQIYYSINNSPALAIMQVLYEQFCAPHQGAST